MNLRRLTLLLALWGTSHCWGSAELLKNLLDQNRLEDALPVCRQYEVLPTRDPSINLTCAWIYFKTYRPEAAQAVLQKSQSSASSPEFQLLKIYGSVASALIQPGSIEKLTPEEKNTYDLKLKSKIIEAQKSLQDFIERYKTHPIQTKAKEVNGELYELKGQLEPAAFIYRGLISEQPNNVRAHWGLGRYYLAQGDLRRAKISLEETATRWPKHIGSRFNLALIAISQSGPQKNKEAKRWLTEAFKLDQSDAGVLEQLGLIFEADGKNREAIKFWRRALEIDPTLKIASQKIQENSVAVVEDLITREKWEEALSQIKAFSQSSGSTPEELLLFEGIANRHLGRFQEANNLLNKFVETNSSSPLALRELGICQLNLKRTPEAVFLFEKAAELEKQEGLNYAWLGFAFEAQKDYEKAAQAWNKASTLFKNPREIKNAVEKVVRLEQKTGKRVLASDDKSSASTLLKPKKMRRVPPKKSSDEP